MEQQLNRKQLLQVLTDALLGLELSPETARVTAESYLRDLERNQPLKLLGLGEIHQIGPDLYTLVPALLETQVDIDDAVTTRAGMTREEELEDITQHYIRNGVPELYARNAASIIWNKRHRPRLRVD